MDFRLFVAFLKPPMWNLVVPSSNITFICSLEAAKHSFYSSKKSEITRKYFVDSSGTHKKYLILFFIVKVKKKKAKIREFVAFKNNHKSSLTKSTQTTLSLTIFL